jgi:hypothetical protein
MKPGWDPYAAALAALDDWDKQHGGWPTMELVRCARANNAIIHAGQRLAETIEILNAAPRTNNSGLVTVTLKQKRMVEASSALGDWNQTLKEHQQ